MSLTPRAQHNAYVRVQVFLDGRGRPGRLSFRSHGSIIRTYRLGRLALTPAWVRELAADVIAGADR